MSASTGNPCELRLAAIKAADLMTPGPLSVRHDAPVSDAVRLMCEHRINAAPVVNDAGAAVGVISMSDVLIHNRQCADAGAVPPVPVGDVMTPAVITVDLDAPAAHVIEKMLGTKVHQLFVADRSGSLAGVITPLDVLRRIHEG
jgi:CBS domain-containing protein